ncbi:hypothetical protein AAFF_G00252240 [Aldrovandia affinis]|uniref:Uncharacterized protein n=1 Tax=Aldrovandia affinis TaxID=143900 RepID=A0AAD7STP4_9TELE|nr:hypothetical protein AAFF_G00252240 [Aldrovandia affinis]
MARIQGNGVQAADSRSLHGTTESLSNPENSFGSDSEVNGFASTEQETDKYGFIGGAQQCSSDSLAKLTLKARGPLLYFKAALCSGLYEETEELGEMGHLPSRYSVSSS